MKNISSILLLLLVLTISDIALSKPFQSSKVVIALNCGSKTEQVTTPEGNFRYVPDEQYVKGSSVAVDYHNDPMANDAQIKFALDKEVYMYERHTYQQMTYELPVRKGTNTIILKFAEMYFQNRGQRVFNIKIGSKIVVQNFDVIEKSGGKFAAHEEYIEVEVKNDGVYFGGSRIPQGIENNKLKLSFVKGRADNPIVQAIIVYHDSVQNSPKQQFQLLKSKWGSQQQMLKAKKEEKELRELIQIQKKKERIVVRNDQLLLQEDQQSGQKQNVVPGEKFGFVRRLLMGPIGILIWSGVFGFVGLFMYRSVFKMGALPVLSKQQ